MVRAGDGGCIRCPSTNELRSRAEAQTLYTSRVVQAIRRH